MEYDPKSNQDYSTRLKMVYCGAGFKSSQQTGSHPVTVSAPLHSRYGLLGRLVLKHAQSSTL